MRHTRTVAGCSAKLLFTSLFSPWALFIGEIQALLLKNLGLQEQLPRSRMVESGMNRQPNATVICPETAALNGLLPLILNEPLFLQCWEGRVRRGCRNLTNYPSCHIKPYQDLIMQTRKSLDSWRRGSTSFDCVRRIHSNIQLRRRRRRSLLRRAGEILLGRSQLLQGDHRGVQRQDRATKTIGRSSHRNPWF